MTLPVSTGVAIVVLMRNEALVLPTLLPSLAALNPPPDQVIVVDGDSTDRSAAIVVAAGLPVVLCSQPRRAVAVNAGVARVSAPIVCILHADTLLPPDAVATIRSTLMDPSVSLAGRDAM